MLLSILSYADEAFLLQVHKLLLGSSSPVLHKVLYELDEESNPDRRLLLDPELNVTLAIFNGWSSIRLEVDGIPPIAMDALLDYMYNDT